MAENEFEHQRDQKEYRKEIEDLKASLNSQYHQEKIIYKDLQDARMKIAQLTEQETSLESQQGGSEANEETNILDINEDDKTENTSLTWDHNMGTLLLENQSEDCKSTPKAKEPPWSVKRT